MYEINYQPAREIKTGNLNIKVEPTNLTTTIQDIQKEGGVIKSINEIKQTPLQEVTELVSGWVKKYPETAYFIQENERGPLVVPIHNNKNGEVWLLESKIDNLSYTPNFESSIIERIYGEEFKIIEYEVIVYIPSRLVIFDEVIEGDHYITRDIDFRPDIYIKYIIDNGGEVISVICTEEG